MNFLVLWVDVDMIKLKKEEKEGKCNIFCGCSVDEFEVLAEM